MGWLEDAVEQLERRGYPNIIDWWKQGYKAAKRIGEEKKFMTLIEAVRLFQWFDKTATEGGVEDPSALTPQDVVDPLLTYSENQEALLSEFGFRLPEEEMGVIEEIANLTELLEYYDLEMPSESDPHYWEQLEYIVTTLASGLKEAEKTAGKVKLQVHGKEHWYGRKGIQKLFDKLHHAYRKEISGLRKQLEEEKLLRQKAERVRFTPTRDFRDGMVSYIARKVYETADRKWLQEKVDAGLVVLGEKVTVKPVKREAHVKIEVKKDKREYGLFVSYQDELLGRSGFFKFSELIEYLKAGEELFDLYLEGIRQVSDAEMVEEELARLPPPFNTKGEVRCYWTMGDVEWDEPSKEDYRIWRTSYTASELEMISAKRLKRISQVKLGTTYSTKRAMIDEIVRKAKVKEAEFPRPSVLVEVPPWSEIFRKLEKLRQIGISQFPPERVEEARVFMRRFKETYGIDYRGPRKPVAPEDWIQLQRYLRMIKPPGTYEHPKKPVVSLYTDEELLKRNVPESYTSKDIQEMERRRCPECGKSVKLDLWPDFICPEGHRTNVNFLKPEPEHEPGEKVLWIRRKPHYRHIETTVEAISKFDPAEGWLYTLGKEAGREVVPESELKPLAPKPKGMDYIEEKTPLIMSKLRSMQRITGMVRKADLYDAIRPSITRVGFDEAIGHLLRKGEIYSPKEGFLKTTEEEPAEPKRVIGMVTVQFTTFVPRFTGIDGRTYGSFKVGDSAEIPKADATKLMARGYAEEVTPPKREKAVGLMRPSELKRESGDLWKSYTHAIIRGNTEEAKKSLRDLREKRSQLLRL